MQRSYWERASDVVMNIIESWNPPPEWFRAKLTWESIEVPEGYEKPPKEEFDAQYQAGVEQFKWEDLRSERDKYLVESDYLFTADYPHPTPEIKQAWMDYRQALRNLPNNTVDAENPVWPVKPSS